MLAGSLEIQMLANMAELRVQMDKGVGIVQNAAAQMQKAADLAGKALGLIGVSLTAAAFSGFIRSAIDSASALDNLSKRTGVAAKDLSSLSLSYKLAGMGNDAMASSLAKLSQEMSAGNVGLRALGVNARDAAGNLKAPTAVLSELADKFADLEDGAGKTALAVEIFGKSGAEMLPLLNAGSEGIREMTEMAERLGIVIENETAAKAAEFNDTLDLLSLGAQGVGSRIAAQLLPTLNSLTGAFLESITQGDRLSAVADVLAAAMKGLYTAGAVVVEAFNTVGKTLGAAAAQVAAVLRGDFGEALKIGQEWRKDVVAGWSETAKTIGKAWRDEGDAAVSAAAKVVKANGDVLAVQKVREESAKKAAAESKKAADEARKLAEAGAKLADSLLAQQTGLSGDFAQKWGQLNAARHANVITTERLILAQKELLDQQPFMKKAMEEAIKVSQALADARKKESDGIEDWMRSQQEAAAASLKSIKDRVQGLQEEEQAAEMARSLNITLAEAIERVALARMKEKQAGFYKDSEGWKELQREIEEREKLIGLLGKKGVREREQAAWLDFFTSIDRTAHDVFVDVANNGMDAFKRVGQTIKAAVLDVLWQLVGRRWLISIGTSIFGGGFGAAANAATGGGAMGLLNGASTLNTAYNAFTGGITSSLGGYISTLGTQFGSTAATSFGMGMQGITLDASLASTYGGTAYSAGSTAAAAMPYVAIVAAAAAVASNLYDKGWNRQALEGPGKTFMYDSNLSPGMEKYNRKLFSALGMSDKWADILSGTTRMAFLFGRKLKDSGLEATLGSNAEGGSESRQYQFYKGGLFRSNKTTYSETDEGVEAYLDNAVTVTREALRAVADSLGAPTAALDTFALSVKESFKDLSDEEADKKLAEIVSRYAEGVGSAFLDGFEKSDVAGWAQRIAAGAGTAAERLQAIAEFPAKMLEAFGTSRDALVQTFVQGLVSGDAMGAGQAVADQLVASIEATMLGSAAGRIFDIMNSGLITPILDAVMTGATVTEALSEASIQRTIARAQEAAAAFAAVWNDPEFKSIMETIRTGFGSALGNAGSAMQYQPRYIKQPVQALDQAADAAAKAADEARKKWEDLWKSLRSDRDSAEIDLLRAMGQEEAALARERARAIEGMDAEQAAYWDGTAAIKRQIIELEKLNALRDEETQLQIELLQARGDEAGAMALITRGMSDAERAAYLYNRALEQQVEAVQALATELPELLDKLATPEQRQAMGYDRIAADLGRAGIPGLTGADLAGAGAQQILQAATAIYQMGETSDVTRLALVRAVSGIVDLRNAAAELADQNVDRAMQALERAVAAQRKVAEEAVQETRAVFDAAKAGARALFGEVEAVKRYNLQTGGDYIAQALSAAKLTGYLPDSKELAEAIDGVTQGLQGEVYATQAEADFQKLVVANRLKGLEAISGDQLTEAERQLNALDGILDNARAQIDALRGIDSSVMSVEAAIANLATAIGAANAAKGLATGGGGSASRPPASGGPVRDYITGANGAGYSASMDVGYQAGTGLPWRGQDIREAAAELVAAGNAKAVYDAVKAQGFTLAQADSILQLPPGEAERWAKSVGLPVFHAGTNFVPRTGMALLEKGEAVVPKQFNPAAFAQANNTERLERLVEGMAEEIRVLRSQLDENNRQARRTADAVNGRPEAPVLVEIA